MLKLPLIIFFNILFLPLYIIFAILCFLLTFFPIYPVVTARTNVENQLKIFGFSNQIFITRVLLNYVFYLFEVLFFDSFGLAHYREPKNFNMTDFLSEVRGFFPQSDTRGFAFIAGHVANLEYHTLPLLKPFKQLKLGDLVGLAKPSRFKFLNKIMHWHRVRAGVDMIWTDKDLFINMSKAFKKGNSLCLIADQKPKKDGVFVRFFGDYAAFPTAGMQFCALKKSIIIYGFCYRIIPGFVEVEYVCGKNFHLLKKEARDFRITESKYINKNLDHHADIYQIHSHPEMKKNIELEVAYFAYWLENKIRKHPTQWSWDYRKWSRKPQS